MRLRVAAVGLAAAALAGCANAGAGGKGRATVWVTRDEGAHVLLVRSVPAGLTAIQGLERVAHVQTRYGGRFVQAIDGIEGSLSRRQDWFYFVNGYEADRGAAEYVLHAGDVEWWDYRSWRHAMHVPVVVGAFPEPFLHGYGGERRPSVVEYVADSRDQAARLAKELHARLVPKGVAVPANANVLLVDCTNYLPSPRFVGRLRGSGVAGSPVWFDLVCVNPDSARFRYSIP